ncbi:MAG: transposase [Oligoflexales bacterium]|nr:transposase [Oligoflexales bacterium]
MDESSKQCTRETCSSIPMIPGNPERIDYGYERNGAAHLFMGYDPFEGYQAVDVREFHTRYDLVISMKSFMESEYKDIKKVTFFLNNLSTHNPKFFYKILPAEKARTLLNKMESLYASVHAIWLNMTEIAFSVLSRECLDRRIPDTTTFCFDIKKWLEEKNKKGLQTYWRFN